MGSLDAYQRKRDFDRTSEPSGEKRAKSSERPRFVIQKHDASTLHYDFRLEIDGALRSWAVPKGPAMDPREKRLAVPTEDHPLDYIDFEGVIPEGEYGAGTVMVWDTGTYRMLKDEDGHLSFHLHGKKLKGGFALTRTQKGKNERWILIKMDDDDADARRKPTSSQPESALTGRTLKQIAKDDEG